MHKSNTKHLLLVHIQFYCTIYTGNNELGCVHSPEASLRCTQATKIDAGCNKAYTDDQFC
mgnify:CR=1 FL=1